jgi:peroxiredoxin
MCKKDGGKEERMKAELKVKVGGRLPDLEVADQDGRRVKLASIRPGALFIYAAADTPG